VVPKHLRTRFFAQRSRISQMCLLAGFVTSGLLLEYGKSHTSEEGTNWTLVVFGGLFITAAVCRFTSAIFLSRHSEPNRGKLIDEHISLAQWRKRLGEHSGAKLLLFLFAMQASVFISGPYFTPYMLKELHLSYAAYMIVISSSLLGKAIGLPFWGRIAHRYGARRLLWIGATSIVPLSSLWIFSTSFGWILFVQAISGLLWAAFELAIVLMFFEAIPRHERTSLVTLYNLSNSSAMVCGTLVGALILSSSGGYYLMFGMSSFCRIFAILLLVRLSNVTDVVPRDVEGALALHPSTQNFDKPIMAGIPETADEDQTPAPRAA
jgi:predicted MFS family arabinose efflux permease